MEGAVAIESVVSPPRRHRLRHSAALQGASLRLLGGGGSVGVAAAEAAGQSAGGPPQLGTADVLVEARELRLLLPRMWRHFRRPVAGSRSIKTGGKKAVTVPVQQLHAWLQGLKGSKAEWSQLSEQMLIGALRTAVQLPPLRQYMGFRFQDPSTNGSWDASNLVGYAEKPLPAIKRSRSHVSWDTYVANFRLSLSEDQTSAQVVRSMARKAVTAHVEKRKRGDPEGPLAREPIVVTAASRCKEAAAGKRIRVVRRSCDLLPAVVIRPPNGPQQWTLIYLHGLGSGALESYAERPHYFFDGSLALKVVAPTAPRREVSCFDSWWQKAKNSSTGWRLTKFLSWYDYLSNHDGAREDAIDWQSLHAVRRALHCAVQKEIEELGGRADRVLLGGKSQGCCTALDAALTFPKPLGGFIGVVGHVLSCTPVEPDGPQRNTPLHFFHEPEDTIMRWDWVQKGEKRLRDAGYRVRSRRLADPQSHGHFVEGVEGAWIRAALRSICGAEEE